MNKQTIHIASYTEQSIGESGSKHKCGVYLLIEIYSKLYKQVEGTSVNNMITRARSLQTNLENKIPEVHKAFKDIKGKKTNPA